MNRLPLVVVFRMRHPELSGDRLGGLIRLEPQISLLVLVRAILLSESVVAEHEIVVSLYIFRIDRQHLLKLRNSFRVFLLQKQNAPSIIADDTILRILLDNLAQLRERIIVFPFRSQNARIEVTGSREIRRQLQGFVERGLRAIQIAFLNASAANVDETIRVLRIGFGCVYKRGGSAFQVALKK